MALNVTWNPIQVVIAVLGVFLCVAILNVSSCPRRRSPSKDCRVGGNTYKHMSEFSLPKRPCNLYKCENRKLKTLQANCHIGGDCYRPGTDLRFGRRMHRCLVKKGTQEAKFEPIGN
ncbi:hypothetical protein PoB_002745700 [Plakobranchus ocellatus]|uniref:Secreted protein n=1 Tax=Plakobranchus ocellatus TaxID=259542 RepID=A0AAV4A0Y0_9GAST|nr:hypothetical protein PoB_002745700 [Plakobranchus ocellatus]